MKIIIIRGSATDPAVDKIAHCLADNGYEVELLLWNRKNTPTQPENGYRIKNFHFSAPQNSAWVFFYYPVWWLYELVYLLRSDAEVIHACDLDTLYPAIIASRLKKTKFVYTIYDFYADCIPKFTNGFMYRCLWSAIAKIEKIGISFSDLLMLADESRFEEVRGSSIKNLMYVYNSPPDLSKKEFPGNRPPDDSSFVIFYAGPVNPMRGIHFMAEAIEDLEGVTLVIGGFIDDEKFFNDTIKPNKNVRFIGWLPSYHDVLAKTMSADILFRFSDPDHPSNKYASPNKLFEAMMCGKPIIVSDMSNMADIVRKTHCGCVVPYGDIQALRRAVKKLRDDGEFRHQLGKNGRDAYETMYNWSIMERRILDAYHMLAGSPGS
jgi:glycosyltransferase involved in cell wall biosynthesis